MSCTGRTDVRIIHRFCNERSHCKTLPLSPVISHSQGNKMIPERGLGVWGKGERRERRFPFPRNTKLLILHPLSDWADGSDGSDGTKGRGAGREYVLHRPNGREKYSLFLFPKQNGKKKMCFI